MPVTLPWMKPDGKPVTRNLLFTWPVDQAIIRQRFNKQWSKARRAVRHSRGTGNGCHVLRHTAASTWLSAGVSLAKVAPPTWVIPRRPYCRSTLTSCHPTMIGRAEVMNSFFAGSSERSCARNVPGKGLRIDASAQLTAL